MTELGKQVWQKMEEMGWENAPEDFHLEYYENIIECTKQALTIPAVVGQSEQLFCPHCEGTDLRENFYTDTHGCNSCGHSWAK